MTYSYLLKYIIIGDQSVGKSCILMQFIDNKFENNNDATIGVQFGSKTIKMNDKVIKLQIWDTAGQQTFQSITRSYYRGTIGVILVYDITSRNSFESVTKWLNEAKNYATNENIEILLVGNKSDMAKTRQVTTQEGIQYARNYNINFIESSAKKAYNTSYAFELLTQKIIEKIQQGLIDANDQYGGIKLGEYESIHSKIAQKRKCC